MRAPLFTVLVLWGCSSQPQPEHIPQLSVDQEGLAQRLSATARRPEGADDEKEAATEEGEPEGAPESDESRRDLVPAHEPMDHPVKPSATGSGDRVAFRAAPSTAQQSLARSAGRHTPDPKVESGRDERAERFRRREQERLGGN